MARTLSMCAIVLSLARASATGAQFCGTCVNGGPPPLVDSRLELSCVDPGANIDAINFVTYGNPPAAHVCGAYDRGSCDSANATAIVTAACLGKASCSLGMDASVWGDPCPAVYKVVAVEATCSSGAGAVTCTWGTTPSPRQLLTVTADAPLEVIAPSLFGLDLEFTRHDIFNGLSAQLVSNNLFALQPAGTSWPYAWPAGVPPHWAPIGSPVFMFSQGVVCSISPAEPACGVTQLPVGAGFDGGMSNGASIGVEAGQLYTISVVASATAPLFLNATLSGGVFSQTFEVPPTGDWATLSANFTAPATIPNASLTLVAFSTGGPGASGTMTLNATSILPANSFMGMRSDVVAQLKALGYPGPLRYPGGCFAPFYRWKEQLGPLLTRPTIWTPPGYCTAVQGGVNAYSDGFSQNAPNIDEYIALCRAVNATPSITIALQFGTAQEVQDAVDLVEYANGNASTVWGALRAARGFPEPFNVSVWYLGNEINMQARYADYPEDVNGVGPPSAAEYAAMLAVLVPALRAVDPTVRLSVVEGGGAWDATWASDAAVGPFVSLTSFHGGYCNSNGPLYPQDFTSEAKFPDVSFLPGLQQLRAELDAARAGNVSISADEWGLGPPWVVGNFNAGHGMFAASLLSVAINNAASTKLYATNYFEPINEGAIEVRQFNAAPTPLGVVLPLFSAFAGWARVGAAPASSGDDDVAVVAALQPSSGDVLVTLSNRNSSTSFQQPVSVALPAGAVCSASASLLTLTPSDLSYWSSYQSATETIPVESTSGNSGNATCAFTVRLPAYGISQIRLSASPSPR